MKKRFNISTSPYLKNPLTTPLVMREILFSLVPIYLFSLYNFGWSVVWLSMAAATGALLMEGLFNKNGLRDNSSLVTALLLALTLPPGFPLWMAFLGGVVSIGMGKLIWGGLGQNVFNPALVGRAFLQAAFPTAITTWSVPKGWSTLFQGTNLAPPFLQGESIDALCTATPLSKMKFDFIAESSTNLFSGTIPGSSGETSALILLLIGAYFVYKKVINWRIPVAILATTAIMALLFFLLDGEKYPPVQFTLMSGGLLFGTVYMATDPVTSPLSPLGQWIFGIGIGLLVILIRYWGGLPEGVMYAILIMNAFTPIINRYVRIRTFGHSK